jgi:hypothetical protein
MIAALVLLVRYRCCLGGLLITTPGVIAAGIVTFIVGVSVSMLVNSQRAPPFAACVYRLFIASTCAAAHAVVAAR